MDSLKAKLIAISQEIVPIHPPDDCSDDVWDNFLVKFQETCVRKNLASEILKEFFGE